LEEAKVAELENLKVARESIEAFGEKDKARLEALLADGSVYSELPTQRRIEGKTEIVQAYEGWWQAFPDSAGTVTNSFASGEDVALEVTWSGTHSGPLVSPAGSIPASGRKVTVPASQVLSFKDGKIREVRHYFDMATLLQQIGAIGQA
jgi:steroid delta-isomerase-like uncharacterized protein